MEIYYNLKLNLSGNRLRILPDSIGNLAQLKELLLQSNLLTHIPLSIGNLHQLKYLNLAYNKLVTIPVLHILEIYNNEINYIPEPVRRLLDKSFRSTIYNDGQNIHNYKIQDSIKKSICILMNINIPDNINDHILDINTKESLSFYSEYNVTFGELLCRVWNRIENHENSDTLKKFSMKK